MMQDDLFAHARNTDPETSHEAAESIDNLTERQTAVLVILEEFGGQLADHELVRQYEKHGSWYSVPKQTPQSIRSRRSELVKRGLVDHWPGNFVKTESGRRARVWAVTDAGREALQ